MTVSVSVAQRRARLVERHRLAVAADSVVDAVDAMIALHGTDPTAAYLSAWARTGCVPERVDEAIYAERSLVRMLGMRRTMFVVPARLVPVVQAACTDDVAKRLRRQLEKDLTTGGVGDGDPGGWLTDVGSGVLRVLHARGGGASGAQLSEGEPRLRTQLSYSLDKSYGGTANITSRVLTLLGAEGHLVRGHRRGGWSSGQFEWFPASTWLGQPADDGQLDGGAARVELARRWLRSFGPAPISDLQWWGGWTGGQTKAAVAALPTAEVDLDGQPGIALADDLEFPGSIPPAAALLPALDPTPMGWQARDWFLGRHRALLFDRTGNIGPTVWWEGRVVGGWAQRASGEIVLRLLEDIGADGAAAVSGQAARLEAWLGANRVTPRFRTPLERELSALVVELFAHRCTLAYILLMAVMTVSEARAALPEVLNRVAEGEEVTITRHGRAVAVIVRPDIVWSRSRAEVVLNEAAQMHALLESAADSELNTGGGISEQYAEELIASIRTGRDSR